MLDTKKTFVDCKLRNLFYIEFTECTINKRMINHAQMKPIATFMNFTT